MIDAKLAIEIGRPGRHIRLTWRTYLLRTRLTASRDMRYPSQRWGSE
jgi:hypothetical protein